MPICLSSAVNSSGEGRGGSLGGAAGTGSGGFSRIAPDWSRAGGRKLSGLSGYGLFGSAITGAPEGLLDDVLTVYFASGATVLIVNPPRPGLERGVASQE